MQRILLLTVMFFITAPVMSQVQESDVLGKWLTDDGEAVLEIYKKGSKFHGDVVWMEEPNESDGKLKADINNPEKALQTRPLMGLTMLKDFVFAKDEWKDGKIYDPDSGKTYSCYMELINPDKLKIRGYIGFSLIGETTYWTRKK